MLARRLATRKTKNALALLLSKEPNTSPDDNGRRKHRRQVLAVLLSTSNIAKFARRLATRIGEVLEILITTEQVLYL
jgi:hypothetical protein